MTCQVLRNGLKIYEEKHNRSRQKLSQLCPQHKRQNRLSAHSRGPFHQSRLDSPLLGLGKAIVEKQKILGWGDSIVETLSKDLQREFPATTGFSADNLWRMRQFFIEYSTQEFLEQAVPELLTGIPWGHHVELLKKVKDLQHAFTTFVQPPALAGAAMSCSIRLKAKHMSGH